MAPKLTRLGDGFLTLDAGGAGETEFGEQVTEVTLAPKSSERLYVLSGGSIANESFELAGKLLPDFGEAESLQEWCFTNRGKEFDFEFVPNKAKSKSVTGRLTVEAVAIGGKVRANDEVDFKFEAVDVVLSAYSPAP